MTGAFETITVDQSGNITSKETHTVPTLRVLSDEIMPICCPKGTEAFIIDKRKAAFSDGKGNWYAQADTPIPGGQAWAALF